MGLKSIEVRIRSMKVVLETLVSMTGPLTAMLEYPPLLLKLMALEAGFIEAKLEALLPVPGSLTTYLIQGSCAHFTNNRA